MEPALQPGATLTRELVVQKEHTIDFMGEESRVLASPWMLLFMEQAARQLVLPALAPEDDTVGVGFQFEHLNTARVGETITVRAELLAIGGNRLTFAVSVTCGERIVGRGIHVRARVNKRWFQRLQNSRA